MLGYLPIALAFGISATGVGMSLLESVLFSALIFAGASQFALLSLLAAGTPPGVASTAALALNLRHILYGPLVAQRLGRAGLSSTAIIAFGLTDEVFATALARLERVPGEARTLWLLGLEAGAYLTWVGGTLMGAAGGEALLSLSPDLAPVLSFALPALFLALLLPLLQGGAVLAAAAGGGVALIMHLHGQTAAGILGAGAAGVLISLLRRWRSGV
ncbi:MAG: AzlC family ABC transporter permease [Euryarchaeota archaeon]|nr:AzlC family ABC transporter permease [Euryarchaeota archaeon]